MKPKQVQVIDKAQQNVQNALARRQHYTDAQSIEILLKGLEKERAARESVEQDLQDEFVNIHIVHSTDFES